MTTLPSLSLGVVLTSDCNLRCAYCYQNAKQPGTLSWRDLRAALDFALESVAQRPLEVVFTGGEPLRECEGMVRAVRYVERHRRGDVEYVVCTNGLLLDRKIARFLERFAFSVQLSFDGIEPAQNLRGNGSFTILDRLLGRLRTEQPTLFREGLRIASTVVPGNVRFLARSVDYFLHQGVQDVAIAPALDARPWRPDLAGELDRQLARVYALSRRHYERTGDVPLRFLRKDRSFEVHRSAVSDWLCGVGSKRSIAVDVDGSLCGCAPLAHSYRDPSRTPLGRLLACAHPGHVCEPNIAFRLRGYRAALKRTSIFNRRKLKHSSYGRCSSCRYLADCMICPMSIVMQDNVSDPHRVPDFTCAFNRLCAKYRRRFPVQARRNDDGVLARTVGKEVAAFLLEQAASLYEQHAPDRRISA